MPQKIDAIRPVHLTTSRFWEEQPDTGRLHGVHVDTYGVGKQMKRLGCRANLAVAAGLDQRVVRVAHRNLLRALREHDLAPCCCVRQE